MSSLLIPRSVLFYLGTVFAFFPLHICGRTIAMEVFRMNEEDANGLSFILSVMIIYLSIKCYNYENQRKNQNDQRATNRAQREANIHQEELRRLEISEKIEERSAAAAATSVKLAHETNITAQTNTFKLCSSMLDKVKELDSDKLIRAASIIPGVINGQVNADILSMILNQSENKTESTKQSAKLPSLEQQGLQYECYDNNVLKFRKT